MSYTCNTFTCHKQLAQFLVAGACPSFTAFLAFIWLCFGNIPVSCRGFTLETWKDTIPITLVFLPLKKKKEKKRVTWRWGGKVSSLPEVEQVKERGLKKDTV